MKSNIKKELRARYTFEEKYPQIAQALDIIGGIFATVGLLYFIFLLIIIIR